jgi:hypothetical protein
MRSIDPNSKRIPKITQEEAAALVCRARMKPDGTPISEEEGRSWTWVFSLHLKHELGSGPPNPLTRLERPMEERLGGFTQVK